VLVPVFNDPNDRIALDILTELFPGREIVPIYSGDLVWGFGTMHCMTQQQPAWGSVRGYDLLRKRPATNPPGGSRADRGVRRPAPV